uniref:Wu:fc23c09 n=1 Tax=Kryptolebias marmoratus TaxID=37003 RepID=A0A3Q3FG73_KRYMA
MALFIPRFSPKHLSNDKLPKLQANRDSHLPQHLQRSQRSQRKPTTEGRTRKDEKGRRKPAHQPVSHVPYGIPYNARYILLMNNHITSIQLDLLSEYESMEFLTLSNNWLTDGAIEGAFEGVPALKRLYLDRNLLQSVPVDLPHSLEELRLDNNRLRLMSEAAWTRCPGLLVLSLSNNSLGNRSESLPDGALSPLCKLRTLNLDYNLLASVPLGLPPSIKDSNRLTNRGLFEDSLLNAKHLESLNLEGNKLRQVPQHLPTSLKTLNLEGNLIFSIKKATFSTLKNLEHLGLARNKIFKVAPGAFKMLPILHQLDLCHNTLQQVPRQLPQGLHSVALTHNKIKAVPRDAFCWGNKSLSGLVRVQLEHNLINMGKLDSQAFRLGPRPNTSFTWKTQLLLSFCHPSLPLFLSPLPLAHFFSPSIVLWSDEFMHMCILLGKLYLAKSMHVFMTVSCVGDLIIMRTAPLTDHVLV